MDTYLLWLVLFVLLVVIEVITSQLTTIWFAIGALVALFGALFGMDFYAQLLLFVVVGFLAFLATKPLKKKLMHKERIPTNADMLLGQTVIALEDFNDLTHEGRVQAGAMDWLAHCEQPVVKGDRLVVKRIEGAKLIVTL